MLYHLMLLFVSFVGSFFLIVIIGCIFSFIVPISGLWMFVIALYARLLMTTDRKEFEKIFKE